MNLSVSTYPLEKSYWSGLVDKLDSLGDIVKEFALMVQNHIWIPLIVIGICIGLMVAFGGKDETSIAKRRAFKVVVGVFIVMSISILVSIVVGFFAPADVKSIGLT